LSTSGNLDSFGTSASIGHVYPHSSSFARSHLPRASHSTIITSNSTHWLHASSAGATRAKKQKTSQSITHHDATPRASAHAVSSGQHLSKHTKRHRHSRNIPSFPTAHYRNAVDDNERTRATTHARRITKSQEHQRYPMSSRFGYHGLQYKSSGATTEPGLWSWYRPSDGSSLLACFLRFWPHHDFDLTTDDHNSSTRA
jgi:hypothetical protein